MADPTASPAGVERPVQLTALQPVARCGQGWWSVSLEPRRVVKIGDGVYPMATAPLDPTTTQPIPSIGLPPGAYTVIDEDGSVREHVEPLDPHDGEDDGIPNVGPLLRDALFVGIGLLAGVGLMLLADLLN